MKRTSPACHYGNSEGTKEKECDKSWCVHCFTERELNRSTRCVMECSWPIICPDFSTVCCFPFSTQVLLLTTAAPVSLPVCGTVALSEIGYYSGCVTNQKVLWARQRAKLQSGDNRQRQLHIAKVVHLYIILTLTLTLTLHSSWSLMLLDNFVVYQ